ncbi:GntR family transcriptional regulator [Streptomyces sp. NPDC046821]|uniref:GntR family transcriptional regulator n=1 Tax=Streptomyces sp. NPDC046821 TaxID=3154702 RepID=UPI0033E84870
MPQSDSSAERAGKPADGEAAGDQPLAELALGRVRHEILMCRLAPGQRITERGLAAEFGLGLSAVRDALTRLDQEGLILTLPRKGYRVAPLTLKLVDDLFGYWVLLGPEIIRRAVVSASDEQLQELLALNSALDAGVVPGEEEATRQSLLRALDASIRMFTVMAGITGNRYLIDGHRRILGELGRVWRLVIQSELDELGGRVLSLQQGAAVIEARDAEGCAEFLRAHIEKSHERVLRMLIRWPSVVGTEIMPIT